MQRTAASIVTASKCAPITPRTTSSVVGVIAVARRAITFSSALCLSGKCEWARTSRILAAARRQHTRALPPPAQPPPPPLRVGAQLPPPPLPHRALQHPPP